MLPRFLHRVFLPIKNLHSQFYCRFLCSSKHAVPNTGLNFDLSDQQKQIQASALKFAKEEIAPKAAHYDKTGEYPWDVIKKAFELGFLSYEIPVEYGGHGMSNVDSVLIGEALRYVNELIGIPVFLSVNLVIT